jgi:hypothetical protein
MGYAILLATAMVALVSTTANATIDICTKATQTPDGFLALREAPGTQFKMIAKIHPGDTIMTYAEQSNQTRMPVTGVYGKAKTIFDLDSTGGFKPAWVASRYTKFDRACTDRIYQD